MSVESDIFSHLKALVPDNRVFPSTFAQPDGTLPEWPAIRFQRVSTEIDTDICGDGSAGTDNVRIQLDLVAKTSVAVGELAVTIRTAMKTFPNSAVLEDLRPEFDPETKTHRISMDYFISLSG
jgi:hypothetical protein